MWRFFKKYKDYPFQKIYISQLKRTYQSIEPFINLGLQFEVLEGLNEISWGEKQGVKDDIIEYKQLVNLCTKHSQIYVIANGGLHYVASHMATDMSRLLKDKYCYSFDSFGFITSSANDFGFDSIFEKWH